MKLKSHFRFNKQERSGIFFFLLVIICLQGAYHYIKTKPFNREPEIFLDEVAQSQLDSIKTVFRADRFVMYPFNPNYISDDKGYRIGLSVEELDRLFAFRKKGQYVNSAKDFQKVTQVSDSLLAVIAPYFKFPEWKSRKKASGKTRETDSQREAMVIEDLNTVSAERLKRISGIGETLSARIIKFRDRLGGFLVNEQLYDVYGLAPDVVERIVSRYQVLQPPTIQKIDVNTATVDQLAQLVYINYGLAKQIVQYRKENGSFASLDELTNVTSFPKDRIDRIKLYLAL